MSFIQPESKIFLGWMLVGAIVGFLIGTTIGSWITFVLLRVLINV